MKYRLDPAVRGGEIFTVGMSVVDPRDPLGLTAYKDVVIRSKVVLLPPTLSQPPDQTVDHGQDFSATWVLMNPSNVERTYEVSPGVGGVVLIMGSSNTGSITVGPQSTVQVGADLQVPLNVKGGSTGSVWVTANDPGVGSATSSFAVRVPDVVGCMDTSNSAFDPRANVNDRNMCEPAGVTGCMDPDAKNYDPKATIPDVCEYWPDPVAVINLNGSQAFEPGMERITVYSHNVTAYDSYALEGATIEAYEWVWDPGTCHGLNMYMACDGEGVSINIAVNNGCGPDWDWHMYGYGSITLRVRDSRGNWGTAEKPFEYNACFPRWEGDGDTRPVQPGEGEPGEGEPGDDPPTKPGPGGPGEGGVQ